MPHKVEILTGLGLIGLFIAWTVLILFLRYLANRYPIEICVRPHCFHRKAIHYQKGTGCNMPGCECLKFLH